MLSRLKKTALGKLIYTFSRRPVIGWPVLLVSRLLQVEALQIAHFYPSNAAHNRTQKQVLKQFEASLK